MTMNKGIFWDRISDILQTDKLEGDKAMNMVIALMLMELTAAPGCRKKEEKDDLRWIDRLEELDTVIDDD